MTPTDLSAEYYELRVGHELALADAAKSCSERRAHLDAAALYSALAVREKVAGRCTALSGHSTQPS